MLRPGDLVNVNLNQETSEPGFFVPVEAIYEDLGSTFVFVVDGSIARKTLVKAILPTDLDQGSSIRIEPTQPGGIGEGTQIVVGGVHYLKDGDAIRIVENHRGTGGTH